jgi:sterol 14-demethylase
VTQAAIPAVGGGLPWLGHMLTYSRNPYRFVHDVATRYGEIATFRLLGQRIVLLTGARASELFYRASDGELDQAAAYQVMNPIFGKGVLYDAPLERRDRQLAALLPPLRGDALRHYGPTIVGEVRAATAGWQRTGEFDVVEFMQELTLHTATACLLGPHLRGQVGADFVRLYRDLEAGVSPLAYYFPHLPLPKFRRRDAARTRIQDVVRALLDARRADPAPPDDLLQSLTTMRYGDGTAMTETEIAGVVIGTIFAGHHTSAGTAAWLLIELLRHPSLLAEVQAEVDHCTDPAWRSPHDLPALDRTLKEVLRLHPPVIILMRKACTDLQFGPHLIRAGDLLWASPPVTHRRADHFGDAQMFDPDRFGPDRREDRDAMAYQPFGGGKHRCAGSGFAAFQITTIVSVLLRAFTFELAAPAETYVDDYRQMIVQPRRPSAVRYRIRQS